MDPRPQGPTPEYPQQPIEYPGSDAEMTPRADHGERTYRGLGTDLTVEGFHTGLDFAGGDGLQIFAPAAGRVVFAAPLTVRGEV